MNYVEILEDEDLADNERRLFLDTIRRNGAHLLELINDLLDLSKIEAENIEIRPSPFFLINEIEHLVRSFASTAQRKGIRLQLAYKTPMPYKLSSDRQRLNQILANLMGNAIKFTHAGYVKLKVAYHPQAGGRATGDLVFSVEDSGVGIAAKDQLRIFEPFVQADSSHTRAFQGTGLGLTISRRIAELLQGELYLHHSMPGKGSEFVVRVPVKDALFVEQAEPLPRIGLPNDGRKQLPLQGASLLIVEDNRDIQKILRRIFRREGARVQLASNGQEGLAKIGKRRPDMVFMDLQMPVMDGYRALEELRLHGFKNPIIALTSHAFEDEFIKCMEKGFDDYMTKPANRQELVDMATKWSVAVTIRKDSLQS